MNFEKIGVVGVGMMGSEIAPISALSGRSTLLSDQSQDAAERAIARVRGIPPFERLDNTQNFLSLSVREILHQAYGERFAPRPPLRQLVAGGDNGRGWRGDDSYGRRL